MRSYTKRECLWTGIELVKEIFLNEKNTKYKRVIICVYIIYHRQEKQGNMHIYAYLYKTNTAGIKWIAIKLVTDKRLGEMK